MSFSEQSFGPVRAWIGTAGSTRGHTVVVDPLGQCAGWAAVGYFMPVEGVLTLLRLEIVTEVELHGRAGNFERAFPNPTPPSISEVGSLQVRSVRLQVLHQRAHDLARHFHQFVEVEKDRSRPGRRGRPDRYYAEWAAKYTALLGSPKPLESLSAQEHLSVSQIRNILGMARRRGLLTPAPKGRAGGRLTDKAVLLLQDERHEDRS